MLWAIQLNLVFVGHAGRRSGVRTGGEGVVDVGAVDVGAVGGGAELEEDVDHVRAGAGAPARSGQRPAAAVAAPAAAAAGEREEHGADGDDGHGGEQGLDALLVELLAADVDLEAHPEVGRAGGVDAALAAAIVCLRTTVRAPISASAGKEALL